MKHRFIITFLLISINFIFSQEKKVLLRENEFLTIDSPENGKTENGIYICNKLDWKIKIPENYIVIKQKQLQEMENKGNIELKNRVNYRKNQNNNHLIGFKLDSKNSFTSSYTPLDNSSKYTLEEHKKLFVESLNKAFLSIEDAKFEVKVSDIKIEKYQFYKVKVEGYKISNNQLVLTQIYFNSLIDNNLFGALISFDNKVQGLMLENNFVSSMQK